MIGVIGPGPHLDVTLLGLAGVINGQYFLVSSAVHFQIDGRNPDNFSIGGDDYIVDVCFACLQINLSIVFFLDQYMYKSFYFRVKL